MTDVQEPSSHAADPATVGAMDDLGRYQRRRRQVLGLLVAGILASLLFVGTPLGEPQSLHEHVEQVGAVLILIAILGRTWCTLYIGGRKSSEIVRGGPYSITRNPLYLFSAIGAAGIGAMSGSAMVALAFAVITAVAFHFVILVEEAHLSKMFGSAYQAYLREVPRFFPDPRLFVETEMLAVRPHFLYRTFADGLVFAASYPFFEIIEALQESGALPVLLRLY